MCSKCLLSNNSWNLNVECDPFTCERWVGRFVATLKWNKTSLFATMTLTQVLIRGQFAVISHILDKILNSIWFLHQDREKWSSYQEKKVAHCLTEYPDPLLIAPFHSKYYNSWFPSYAEVQSKPWKCKTFMDDGQFMGKTWIDQVVAVQSSRQSPYLLWKTNFFKRYKNYLFNNKASFRHFFNSALQL